MEIIGFEKGRLVLLDQRIIPHKIRYIRIKDSDSTYASIKDMVVRGAPAIGIAAAYGYYLGFKERPSLKGEALSEYMKEVKDKLLSARPTAVNLMWALNEMERSFDESRGKSREDIDLVLFDRANEIKRTEIESNHTMGEFGADEFERIAGSGKINVLTHCNAGALATGGWGTALGVIRSSHKRNIIDTVYADETRPRLQGARLTCFELNEEGISYKLISDNMSGHFMKKGIIDAVVVGADRIAANGDVANKIGTYMVAVLANRHSVPFYVAAPLSTFDFSTLNGDDIDIEERSSDEVLFVGKHRISPCGTQVMNPAFDVTPAELVTAYITEKGVVRNTDELQ